QRVVSQIHVLSGKRRVVLIANVRKVKGSLVLVVINESGVSAGYGCSQTCRYCSGGKCTGASRHGNTVRTRSRGSRHGCWPGRRRCRRQSRRASLPPALPERLCHFCGLLQRPWLGKILGSRQIDVCQYMRGNVITNRLFHGGFSFLVSEVLAVRGGVWRTLRIRALRSPR